MRHPSARLLLLLPVIAGLAACAPQSKDSAVGAEQRQSQQSSPKRIVAAIRGDPHTVYQQLNPSSNIPGIDELQQYVHAGLTVMDSQQQRHPVIAEAVPSIENGLWRVLPNGSMETTWVIRSGARWQDGTPFTAADLSFTVAVIRDPDLPIFGEQAYESIDRVEAPNDRTVTVTWVRPHIFADTLFSYDLGLPIPRHLLERAYLDDKDNFLQHPYWSTEFVGAGPFRLKDWVRGSHLIVEAHPDYVLGRPKLDEIEVRFITDPGTLAANMLAGAVDMPVGGRLSIEWAIQVRDRWGEGRLEPVLTNWIVVFPQFISPKPPIVTNLEFRRALMYAIDRQAQVDTLQYGLSSPAQSFLYPDQADYRDIEARVMRYPYDPGRAVRSIEGLGYQKGADGSFRDAAGQKLSVELRTSQGDDLQEKAMFSTADYWEQLGVGVEQHFVVPQRARDREYRATFPGFDVKRNPNDLRGLRGLHSSLTALPENNFLANGNNSRYVSPEFDALIDGVFSTIPKAERTEILGRAIAHIAEHLNLMGLFYNIDPMLIPNRLTNVMPATGSRSSASWNAYQWDLKEGG
ncbi:MAG: hypothetical protein HW416_3153 [Chloroflexi bacterium]|nr:hypothetical protein [Chloroflexota bacterium]